MSLANAIRALIPDIDFERECILVDNGEGPRIAKWNRPEKQPTVAEIAAAQVVADSAQQAEEAKRIESHTARAEAKQAYSELQPLIEHKDPAIALLAAIMQKHLLATVGR